eukprot:TRINITY_DN256_c0_g2_i1.p1 TRINITY_DN256_c0_g2~~TRINITY_DN256_c0_g2_i1.p1  ORF type:complete len:581 (-),score=84.98 TRINITY_DN256_c0_g2_i1:44-1786(-)
MFSGTGRLVKKATSDDETPTPFYVLKDITDITHKSMKDSQYLMDYLLNRLAKNSSPAVKLKCLRVLRHVIEHGDATFRRDMARRLDVVRECINFRGPEDAVYGFSPYKLVQDEAKIVVNVIFTTEESNSSKTKFYSHMESNESQSGGKKVMTGFGGGGDSISSDSADVAFTESGRKHMPGLGSTDYVPKSPNTQTGLLNKLWRTKETPKPDWNTTNLSPFPNNTTYSPTVEKPPHVQHVKGRVGGGWGDGSAPAPIRVAAPTKTTVTRPVVTNVQPDSGNDSSGSTEQQIVDEITAPGGVRLAPPRDLLHKFCGRCTTLDVALVCDLLLDKLDSEIWQSRMKSLCVMDEMLKRGVPGAKEHFAQNFEEIQEQVSSSQKSIQNKAKKILAVIGAGLTQVAEPTSSHTPQIAQHIVTTPTNSGAQKSDSSFGALFAGMNLNAPATVEATSVVTAPKKQFEPLQLLQKQPSLAPTVNSPTHNVNTHQNPPYAVQMNPVQHPGHPVYIQTPHPTGQVYVQPTYVYNAPYTSTPAQQVYPNTTYTQAGQGNQVQPEGFGFISEKDDTEDSFSFVKDKMKTESAKT